MLIFRYINYHSIKKLSRIDPQVGAGHMYQKINDNSIGGALIEKVINLMFIVSIYIYNIFILNYSKGPLDIY